ncbi:MAG: CPBP family intramembrane metalloprotease [Cyclobacteriaceae bacterium]|nr:CPBP family intramembrane metalloprotease [Cyclobacteriaceae bacterium]
MDIFIEPIVYFILLLPLLLIGKKKEHWGKPYLIVFALYLILDNVVTALPIHFEFLDFMGLKMNWTGKIFSYLLATIFLLSYKKVSLKEFGFTLKQKGDSKKFALKTTLVITFIMVLYCVFIGRYKSTIENIMFQLTMPSIIEEIAVRGILLTLLSMVFIKNMKVGNTYFGMGAIITAVLFGLWHGLNVTSDFEISMNWIPFIYTGIMGFVLALVKERTGSLLFPIIINLIINILPNTMGYVF